MKVKYRGYVPNRIRIKAEEILEHFSFKCIKMKKITSLPGYFSLKLNKNYRLILSVCMNLAFVSCHDKYEHIIKVLKNGG